MSDLDTSTIPVLADLDPVESIKVEEVRRLAGPIASAIAMSSTEGRVRKLTKVIETALSADDRPEDAINVVMLLVPLLDPDCRAAACARIGTGAEARPHLDLWLWVARHTLDAPPEGLPLTIAGYAAARAGATDLAIACFDRALASIAGLADARAYRNAVTGGTKPEHLHPHYPPR